MRSRKRGEEKKKRRQSPTLLCVWFAKWGVMGFLSPCPWQLKHRVKRVLKRERERGEEDGGREVEKERKTQSVCAVVSETRRRRKRKGRNWRRTRREGCGALWVLHEENLDALLLPYKSPNIFLFLYFSLSLSLSLSPLNATCPFFPFFSFK